MSGPILPPLTVTEVDGSPVGRPITTIKVSNGDLTVSGNTATIDTSGSGGTPATPADSIQFNSDPAGTFTGDAGFVVDTAGGGATTKVQIGQMMYGGGYGAQNVTLNGSVTIASEGVGQVFLQGSGDGGGTWTDTIVNVMCNDDADEATLKLQNNAGIGKEATITLDGSLDLIIDNTYAGGGNIELLPGTGKYVKIGGGAAAGTLTSNGAFDLQLSTNSGTNSGTITIEDGVNGTIEIVPNGTGLVKVPNLTVGGTYAMPTDAGTDAYVMTTDGAGTASWAAAGGGGASDLSGLSDVLIDTTEFPDGILIQPDSGGSAPTTGTLSSAEENVGIGMNTFSTLTTGYKNTAIGSQTLASATTTGRGVAIGFESLTTLEDGNNNTAVGFQSLKSQTGGNGGNAAIGTASGTNVTTGFYNTFLGYYTGFNLTEGADNICIGDYAGKSLTTGDGCVFIGTETTADSATDDLQLKIAGAHSFGATSMTWISSDSTGSCYQGDNASSWSTTSDRTLKREIVDATKGLDAINQIRVRNFRYVEKAEPITEIEIDDEGEEHRKIIGYDGENRYNLDPEPLRVGVIAQELQEVLPEAVTENLNGHLTVNTDSINWALLKAVQELSAKVEALEANQ